MAKFKGQPGKWVEVQSSEINEGDIIRVAGPWSGGFVDREIGPEAGKDTIEKFVPDVTLPDEPGFYEDKDGDVWFLDNYYKTWQYSADGESFEEADIDPTGYLPFKRLRLTTE